MKIKATFLRDVSPSKGNQGTTRGKAKILLTSVEIEPTTSRLDLPLLCWLSYESPRVVPWFLLLGLMFSGSSMGFTYTRGTTFIFWGTVQISIVSKATLLAEVFSFLVLSQMRGTMTQIQKTRWREKKQYSNQKDRKLGDHGSQNEYPSVFVTSWKYLKTTLMNKT